VEFPEFNWTGKPLDLSEDPNIRLLHPEEISLAANLRMDCATYLTNKRRIFVACIECMKVGKAFKKTNSQQACKIDVNKASKLWEAFDKVGWFEERHFSRILRRHKWCLQTGGSKRL
jgi:SWIRM domain